MKITVLCVALILMLSACSELSETTPPPLPPPATTSVDMDGQWLQSARSSSGYEWFEVLLTLEQVDGNLSGTASIPGAGDIGPIEGSVSGNEFQLRYYVSPGTSQYVEFRGTATSSTYSASFTVTGGPRAGDSGVATGERVTSAPPPPPSQPPPPGTESFTLTLENTTFTPMLISIGSASEVAVQPGATTTRTYPQNPGTISYSAETSGATTSGDVVGLRLTWSDSISTEGRTGVHRRLVVDSDYFFLRIRNYGSRPLTELRVNYDLRSETLDNVSISNSAEIINLGYYRAFSNSRVSARLGSTTYIVSWDDLNLPFTANQSILLRNSH